MAATIFINQIKCQKRLLFRKLNLCPILIYEGYKIQLEQTARKSRFNEDVLEACHALDLLWTANQAGC